MLHHNWIKWIHISSEIQWSRRIGWEVATWTVSKVQSSGIVLCRGRDDKGRQGRRYIWFVTFLCCKWRGFDYTHGPIVSYHFDRWTVFLAGQSSPPGGKFLLPKKHLGSQAEFIRCMFGHSDFDVNILDVLSYHHVIYHIISIRWINWILGPISLLAYPSFFATPWWSWGVQSIQSDMAKEMNCEDLWGKWLRPPSQEPPGKWPHPLPGKESVHGTHCVQIIKRVVISNSNFFRNSKTISNSAFDIFWWVLFQLYIIPDFHVGCITYGLSFFPTFLDCELLGVCQLGWTF